jgi:hypothetical protein
MFANDGRMGRGSRDWGEVHVTGARRRRWRRERKRGRQRQRKRNKDIKVLYSTYQGTGVHIN